VIFTVGLEDIPSASAWFPLPPRRVTPPSVLGSFLAGAQPSSSSPPVMRRLAMYKILKNENYNEILEKPFVFNLHTSICYSNYCYLEYMIVSNTNSVIITRIRFVVHAPSSSDCKHICYAQTRLLVPVASYKVLHVYMTTLDQETIKF
jgi:hypothetical protein